MLLMISHLVDKDTEVDEEFHEYLKKIRSERHLEVKHGGRVRNADPYGEIWIDPLGI